MSSRDFCPLISVIIPAHNEEKYVARAVVSVKKSSWKNVEVIVVCNDCKDDTLLVSRKLGCHAISTKKRGVSRARNIGARAAKGEILCFLDADSELSPDLLGEVVLAVSRGAVGGYTRTRGDDSSLPTSLMWFLGNIGRAFFPAASGFCFCRKNFFIPYDESKDIAEDTYFLLALRKRGRLKYISSSFIRTSMRRQRQHGFLRFVWQTFSGFFWPRKQEYVPVR